MGAAPGAVPGTRDLHPSTEGLLLVRPPPPSRQSPKLQEARENRVTSIKLPSRRWRASEAKDTAYGCRQPTRPETVPATGRPCPHRRQRNSGKDASPRQIQLGKEGWLELRLIPPFIPSWASGGWGHGHFQTQYGKPLTSRQGDVKEDQHRRPEESGCPPSSKEETPPAHPVPPPGLSLTPSTWLPYTAKAGLQTCCLFQNRSIMSS